MFISMYGVIFYCKNNGEEKEKEKEKEKTQILFITTNLYVIPISFAVSHNPDIFNTI